jgi:hypothetical protein
MKAFRFAIAAGVLAVAAGCSRSEAPVKATYDGPSTRSFLLLVGQVRSQMNNDNKERIPALISGVDAAMLDDQASKLAVLKQSLSKFPTDRVDPDAVQFAQDLEGILDAYQSVCKDSAELYREVARQDEAIQGEEPRMPGIKAAIRAPQVDTLGAVAALVDAMEHAGQTKKPAYMSSDGMVQKLRDDHERLLSSKESHRLFTLKVKADFAKRYPDQDWTAKEILP